MEKDRCEAGIYKRDTLRYTGRGSSGFEMHYTYERCSHKVKINGRCGKHQNKARFSNYKYL